MKSEAIIRPYSRENNINETLDAVLVITGANMVFNGPVSVALFITASIFISVSLFISATHIKFNLQYVR